MPVVYLYVDLAQFQLQLYVVICKVSALSLDPSGARLVSGGYEYDVKFWDFAGMDSSLRCFRTITPCERCCVMFLLIVADLRSTEEILPLLLLWSLLLSAVVTYRALLFAHHSVNFSMCIKHSNSCYPTHIGLYPLFQP